MAAQRACRSSALLFAALLVAFGLVVGLSASVFAQGGDIRLVLAPDSTEILPDDTGYVTVRLVNLNSVAAFQIWVRVGQPDITFLPSLISTASTAVEGWERVDFRSLVGDNHDLLMTAISDTVGGVFWPPMPGSASPKVLVRIPYIYTGLTPLDADQEIRVFIETDFLDHFGFSTPEGQLLCTDLQIVEDSTCLRCVQWNGSTCVQYIPVALPPCDMISVAYDTTATLDTMCAKAFDGEIVVRACSPIPLVSDVNNDGLSLTVADLVELARYLEGEIGELAVPANADLNGDCLISWDDFAIYDTVFNHYPDPPPDPGPWPRFPECTCAHPVKVCCTGVRGNADGKTGQMVDLSDLSTLLFYLSTSGAQLRCYDEANIDGLGIVDLSDLSTMIAYLANSIPLVACP